MDRGGLGPGQEEGETDASPSPARWSSTDGTTQMLTIYLHKKLDLFTNLRPGGDARDLRQNAQKGTITCPLFCDLFVFHLWFL